VLGISALAAGGEGYYLNAVATGIDEYYRGVGEAPGTWAGVLAAHLGVSDDVDPGDFAALWVGRDPSTGETLGRFAGRTVGGFDLCWRAPKSVSLLYAFGEPHVAAAVRDAHDAAVTAAFTYVEQRAAGTRTGHGGAQSLAVDGLVAAAFRHRTSRSGDPHLHTHVLVANMARAVDGKWRTLDGRLLYHHAKTAGYLYQAHLRHELTVRLGVTWEPVAKGTADIAGIDRTVIWAFSDRRRQIVEHLDTTGFTSARAAQIATLAIRPDKTAGDTASIRHVWHTKAAEIGFDPRDLDQVLHTARTSPQPLASQTGLADRLLSAEGLTRNDSTFDRRSALRAVADAATNGSPVTDIESFVDTLLESPQVVPLGPGSDVTRSTRYSTVELVRLEHRLLSAATDRFHDGTGVLPLERIEHALAARPTISAEQADMVWRLCSDGAGVAVVAAPAGTGKTFALGAARDAWTAQGYEVLGAAVAAKAARELEHAAHIPSTTLTRLTAALERGQMTLAPNTVIVIDEAGMAGTRRLAPILDAAHTAGAKVVLVGDPRQLPAIEAGGLLNALTRLTDPITLTENRRQHEPWEHHALDQLRSGNVDQALAAYHAHHRIRTHDTIAAVRAAMVDAALAARRAGEDVLMVALHRSDVTALNAELRSHLVTDQSVHGPELILGLVPYKPATRSCASATTTASVSATATEPPSTTSTPTSAPCASR
jgi:conjugative relaxase-like TrwC/TraI family protein